MNTPRAPLGLDIVSAIEGEERIPIELFAAAVAGWAELVRRITLEQSGARPLVQWMVQKLEVGSTHVDLAPVLVPKSEIEMIDAENVRLDVPQIVVNGLERIERGEDPSEVFSAEAAEQARNLLRPLLSERIATILVRNAERELALTKHGAGQHQEPSAKLRSIGSIEGELKAVSFTERRPFFSIYRSGGGRATKCYFDEGRFLDQVLANLRQRVVVSGRISRAEDGSLSIVTDVRMIRRLGGSGLPQPSDLVGIQPDLTEGLPSEQWLERRRRG